MSLRFGVALEAWEDSADDGDFRALLRGPGEANSSLILSLGEKAYSARSSLPLKLGGSADGTTELFEFSFLTFSSTLSSISQLLSARVSHKLNQDWSCLDSAAIQTGISNEIISRNRIKSVEMLCKCHVSSQNENMCTNASS